MGHSMVNKKIKVVPFYQSYTRIWPKSAELCDFQNRKLGIIEQCTTRVRDFVIAMEISGKQGSKMNAHQFCKNFYFWEILLNCQIFLSVKFRTFFVTFPKITFRKIFRYQKNNAHFSWHPFLMPIVNRLLISDDFVNL